MTCAKRLCRMLLFLVLVVGTLSPFGLLTSIAFGETAERTYLLDQALETIAMRRSDLSMKSDVFSSPYASRTFKRWMENPIEGSLEVQKEADMFLEMSSDPFLWARKLGGFGEVYSTSPIAERQQLLKLPGVPAELEEAAQLLLGAVGMANMMIEDVRSRVPGGSMSIIERYLYPDGFAGEDVEKQGTEPARLKELRRALYVAGSVNRKKILEAGLTIVRALDSVVRLLKKVDFKQERVKSLSFATDLGVIEIGGTGSDVHETPAILIIDCGGNDLYLGRTASGRQGRCSVVLDLDGDDTYLGEAGTQGSGVWGVGVLFDLAGDDLYKAGSCSQGAGLFGFGMLVDGGGTDIYLGERFVQAAASWGWGGLIDIEGEDTYRCEHSGQAYAGVLGVSSLCDLEGNDKYISGVDAPDPREAGMNQSFAQGFAYGMRNLAAGGLALLADRSGNDVYQCGYFGQGASYWMGVGLLYDENGKDTYIARRYAQGAGIHFSFGALIDVAGNDDTLSWGVSQGCGHDYGVGILINEDGDDTYVSQWLSMGASEANGVGIFVDNAGNDVYDNSDGIAVGRFVKQRHSGGVGLFIDAGGNDRYSNIGSNNTVWGMNRWAVGVDKEANGVSGLSLRPSRVMFPHGVEAKRRKRERETLLELLAKSERAPHPANVEEMLSVASHWGFEKAIPKEAAEKLFCMVPERSVPAMVDMVGTPNVMSLLFMEKFFSARAYLAVPALVEKA
ncbi:MAG: hypothetical protein JRJ65_14015, partial [Deltaproteobacteria bacterium]|nr:hypothetical protein [Deltaproteobacteria bacterium]